MAFDQRSKFPNNFCSQGYLPATTDRRESMLEKKRKEYHNFLKQYYSTRHQEIHQETHRQVNEYSWSFGWANSWWWHVVRLGVFQLNLQALDVFCLSFACKIIIFYQNICWCGICWMCSNVLNFWNHISSLRGEARWMQSTCFADDYHLSGFVMFIPWF